MSKTNSFSKISYIICYLLSFSLIAAYTIILVAGIKDTGSSEEYRMYYISNELSRYLSPDGLKDYSVNEKFAYHSENGTKPAHNIGKGFANTEEFGTWAVGNKSDLYFYVENPDTDYTFYADISLNAGYKNYLCVNNNWVSDFDADESKIYIDIPKEYINPGLNIISFCTNDYVLRECDLDKTSEDKRLLNLYLRYAALYEK